MAEENGMAVSNAQTSVVVHGLNSIFLDMQRFEFAKKVASMLAASRMVPKHFQGPDGVGSCMIAMNLAERMGVDVFMLMQTMYVVHGRPGLEGKLVIALVNGCGRFDPIEFQPEGSSKTDKGIERPERMRAFATELKSGKVLYGPWVSWDMAKAEGWLAEKKNKETGYVQISKWQHMPELMFSYRSATFFARVHCPEVLMGLKTKEEIEDTIVEMVPDHDSYRAPKIEGANGTPHYDIKTAAPKLNGAAETDDGLTVQQKTLVDEVKGSKPGRSPRAAENLRSLILGKMEIVKSLPEERQNYVKARWVSADLGPWPLDPPEKSNGAPPPGGDTEATIECHREQANIGLGECERTDCPDRGLCDSYKAYKAMG